MPDENHQQEAGLSQELLEPAAPRVSPAASTLTLPLGKDLSLWHEKSCRPFLLEFMQNRTMLEIEQFTQATNVLEFELTQYLTKKLKGSKEKMRFLDFEVTNRPELLQMPDIDELYSMELSTFPSSASSSRSSLNSISSQISDSELNDVQQSILEFLKDLNEAKESLFHLEWKYSLKFAKSSLSLKGDAKMLHSNFKELANLLRKGYDTEGLGYRKY